MESNDVVREVIQRHAQAAEKERLLSEFNALDKASINKMSDIDLATWQSGYPKDSPQSIFAEQLWRYRLAWKSAKFGAVIATLAALAGALAGYMLPKEVQHIPEHKTNAEAHQNGAPPIVNKDNNALKK